MGDEKIILPDFLIAELYKSSLVELASHELQKDAETKKESGSKTNVDNTPGKKIKFLGENNRRVAILVNEPDAVFLMEEELAFLTSILKACQLNLADIAIVNTAAQEVNYELIKQQLYPATILLFDIEPSAIRLPFLIPAFQIQKFDGCAVMVAPALSNLNKPTQEGKVLKTRLWMSLKQIFNIA